MPPHTSAQRSDPQASRPNRAGLHGAAWTKLMLWLMRTFSARFCEGLCVPGSVIFYGVAGQQRRAILHNLTALHPHLDPWTRWFRGLAVFYQFALVYLDRLYHLHFKRPIEWDLPDLGLLHQMQAEPGGVLIFTAHSGNYDIGATLFASKFGRPVHIVRVPERTQELQDIREAELRQIEREDGHLKVHYNTTADAHLGLQLCRLLQNGDVVAVQGDRVLLDVSSVPVTHEGTTFHLPKGPLVLAEVTRCPCYPIFLTRTGTLRYRIHVAGPFVAGGERVPLTEIAKRWLDVLHPFVALNSDQWFVFEPLLDAMSR